MNKTIKENLLFVLMDDNEVMRAALSPDSDLDDENKAMNRKLIQKHEQMIAKVEQGEKLTQNELQLIRDSNEIHLNDTANIQEHYQQAVELNEWLDRHIELNKDGAMKILERHLDKDSGTPARVYRALHTLWEGRR